MHNECPMCLSNKLENATTKRYSTHNKWFWTQEYTKCLECGFGYVTPKQSKGNLKRSNEGKLL